MKSYTDLEQIKKLAEILPIETADMWVHPYWDDVPNIGNADLECNQFPCWSLTALFCLLPLVDFTMPQLIGTPKTLYRCIYNDDLKSHAYDNPVDACVEMVIKLKERNLL